MHSYQKVKYSYINDNFMKSIKNITKGIITIHYNMFYFIYVNNFLEKIIFFSYV